MIEHIEAYLKQHYCRDYFNSYGETVEDDHYFMYREEVDGLIELIVRECIGCCEQVISDPVPKDVDTWLNGGTQCIDEIKQHFGVTE